MESNAAKILNENRELKSLAHQFPEPNEREALEGKLADIRTSIALLKHLSPDFARGMSSKAAVELIGNLDSTLCYQRDMLATTLRKRLGGLFERCDDDFGCVTFAPDDVLLMSDVGRTLEFMENETAQMLDVRLNGSHDDMSAGGGE